LQQLAREKDQETLTNTIKQSTQQMGKEGTKTERERTQVGTESRFEEGEVSRGELHGSPQGHKLTACWLMTTVERVIERASASGRQTFLLLFGFSAAPQSAAQSRTKPT
jgi:hypothetical protein